MTRLLCTLRIWLAFAALTLAGCGGAIEDAPPVPPQQRDPHVAVAGSELAVGARVAARWTDGKFYPGRIAALEGGRYSIAYDDGDALVVDAGSVLPMAQPGTLAVGEHVLAVWKDGKMYPGVLADVRPGGATVRWDDGDVPLVVAEGNIARLAAGRGSQPPVAIAQAGRSYPGLAAGTPVAARWKDGNYWLGQIAGAVGSGYRIHYADGDVLDVQNDAVIPCGQVAFKVGDHVMAHWKNARMYPGKITSVQAGTATVQWDDGDVPLAVPLSQVAPY